MWRTLVLIACALTGGLIADLAAAVDTTEVGKIVLVVGEARITGKEVKVGDSVPVGAELSTGADGYLYLKTIDNGFLILRPGSIAVVEAYQVDLANPQQSRFKFTMRQGVARSISGDAVSKARQNFRFNTPVAAIGVRGTDFSIYTDSEITRIAVISGGVIVSGFDGHCVPQGSGPCEGAGSQELFAGTLGVLQILKGEITPNLIKDNTLSPDIVAPPRHDEPSVPAASASARNKDSAKLDIDEDNKESAAHDIKEENVKEIASQDNKDDAKHGAAPSVKEDIKTTPVEHQDVSLDPIKQEQLQPILWGRWEQIAKDLPATVDVSDLDKNIYGMITIPDSSYILLWNKNEANTVQIPATSSLSFSLQAAQAHVTEAQGQIAASVRDGMLNFNFDRSTFSTRIGLDAAGQAHTLSANGGVTLDGIFYSDQNNPGNMIVRGALFQTNRAKELQDMTASYVFQSTLNNGSTASGVTFWDKPVKP
jgi:hypothetical protein